VAGETNYPLHFERTSKFKKKLKAESTGRFSFFQKLLDLAQAGL
jgi:hypothetical protein